MARNDLVMSKIMGTWGELDLRRSLIRLKKCALLKSWETGMQKKTNDTLDYWCISKMSKVITNGPIRFAHSHRPNFDQIHTLEALGKIKTLIAF